MPRKSHLQKEVKPPIVKWKTGDTCMVSGVYKCYWHPEVEIIIYANETFPFCISADNHATSWIYARPT